jgi:hypothetical protein
MDASIADVKGLRGWSVVMPVLGMGAFLIVLFVLEEPVAFGFEHAERVAYYRATSALLVTGTLACLVGVGWSVRGTPSAWRTAGVALGIVGAVAGVFLLALYTGLCGPSVLWGRCQP